MASSASPMFGDIDDLPTSVRTSLLDLDFALPDAEEACSFDDGSAGSGFKLAGMDALQGNLAELFAMASTLPPTSATKPLPPGLAPPPGLKAPPSPAQGGTPFKPPAREASDAGHKLEGCTTAMLRNIPNKYDRDRLVEQLHKQGFKHDIDFLYLPIDFKNKCNVGYVFLNFKSTAGCMRFAKKFDGANALQLLPGYNSSKVCEVSPARVQGRDANVRRLQSSPLMSQLINRPDWLPILFEAGEPQAFPVPGEAFRVAAPRASAGCVGRFRRQGQ